ncbi:nuclear transport factor 2 family protein [Sorangium sp. So ce363]|uniref:nuclear transport factor 2 family protein n=1 Tax=Sorangium sp. So ce363 TaxID=3133304 RepID=UPI003F623831
MKSAPWIGLAAVCLFVACSDESGDTPDDQGGTTGGNTTAASAGSSGAGGDASSSGSTSSGSTSSAGFPASAGSGGEPQGSGGDAQGSGGDAQGSGGDAQGSGGDAHGSGGGAQGGAGVGGSGAGGSGAGGSGSRCDPEESRANKALVAQAIDALFVQKDVSAIDRYWADPYLQHNPIATSGVATLKNLMRGIVTSGSFSYQRLRTFGECDLVVVQGRYSQTGVIFDMFRVKDDRIMEHWDSDSNQASATDGPKDVEDEALTGQNRAHVLSFIDAVLIGGAHARASEFLGASYVEHRDTDASGPAALVEYVKDEGISYVKVHHVIADGNFVFTLSEGKRNNAAFGFYDLFRVEGGDIVEHWDSRRSVPNSTMSGLPIF